MSARKAVVSYPVNATEQEKARACMDGIRECAAEAIGYGADLAGLVAELEQIANDARECGGAFTHRHDAAAKLNDDHLVAFDQTVGSYLLDHQTLLLVLDGHSSIWVALESGEGAELSPDSPVLRVVPSPSEPEADDEEPPIYTEGEMQRAIREAEQAGGEVAYRDGVTDARETAADEH